MNDALVVRNVKHPAKPNTAIANHLEEAKQVRARIYFSAFLA